MFSDVQHRQSQASYHEEQQRLARERDELQRRCASMVRLSVQFQHGIRRKELEYDKLQDKLRYHLAEKKREAKASMEIVGRFRKESQQGRKRGAAKMDEDMYKVSYMHYTFCAADLTASYLKHLCVVGQHVCARLS